MIAVGLSKNWEIKTFLEIIESTFNPIFTFRTGLPGTNTLLAYCKHS
jgi:hypothetical protein